MINRTRSTAHAPPPPAQRVPGILRAALALLLLVLSAGCVGGPVEPRKPSLFDEWIGTAGTKVLFLHLREYPGGYVAAHDYGYLMDPETSTSALLWVPEGQHTSPTVVFTMNVEAPFEVTLIFEGELTAEGLLIGELSDGSPVRLRRFGEHRPAL
jgi:hypothetical protein